MQRILDRVLMLQSRKCIEKFVKSRMKYVQISREDELYILDVYPENTRFKRL